MSKTAFILAAGFGTRLKPWTDYYPKPLMTIHNKPVIAWHIDNLLNQGITHIIINAHHLKYKLVSIASYYFYNHPKAQNARLTVIEEDDILGTGGALFNVKELIEEDNFFLINSDIIFKQDLKQLYQFHLNKNNLATMLLRETDNKQLKQVAINKQKEVISIGKEIFKSGEALNTLCFTGIHIISKSVFKYLNGKKFQCIIRDIYKRAAAHGESIGAFITDQYWLDMGSIGGFKAAQQWWLNENGSFTASL